MTDARALLAAGRHGAAVIMGTYALEILLKACVCKLIRERRLPRPFETHDLEGLLVLAGLRSRLNRPKHVRVKANWSSLVGIARDAIEYRYLPDAVLSARVAQDFLHKLQDPAEGVIPWLEQYL